MTPDKTVAVAVLVSGNAAFWLAVLARTRASARHAQHERIVARPRRTEFVLRLVVATNIAYYAVALAWLVHAPLAGPLLWAPGVITTVAGAALMLVALGLVGWSFVVFGSWRVRAEIAEGHELMTAGPFRLGRHPIYAGIILLFASSFVLVPRVGFLLAALANAWSHDVRARTEEEALIEAFGPRYRQYMAHTNRLLPGLY